MQANTRGLLGLFSIIYLYAASFATVHAHSTSLPLPVRLVYEFQNGTWVENLWVRPNGDILVTVYTDAAVYLVSNPSAPSPDVSLVHVFSHVTNILGIIETEPNIFAVTGANFSSKATPVNGTASVWELDLRSGTPAVREITAMPEAVFPNGIDATPASPTTLLIADSSLGVVWRLDTRTGIYSIAIKDAGMVVAPGAPVPIGINGVRVHKGYLYWTNSIETVIYRLRITPEGYRAPGAVAEVVVTVHDQLTDNTFLDDLFIGPVGQDIIWAATNPDNYLVAVNPQTNDTAVIVAGAVDQLTLAGSTACQFGRGKTDKRVLYVVTSGGEAAPVNGTLTQGGKIVAVDTSSFVGKY